MGRIRGRLVYLTGNTFRWTRIIVERALGFLRTTSDSPTCLALEKFKRHVVTAFDAGS